MAEVLIAQKEDDSSVAFLSSMFENLSVNVIKTTLEECSGNTDRATEILLSLTTIKDELQKDPELRETHQVKTVVEQSPLGKFPFLNTHKGTSATLAFGIGSTNWRDDWLVEENNPSSSAINIPSVNTQTANTSSNSPQSSPSIISSSPAPLVTLLLDGPPPTVKEPSDLQRVQRVHSATTTLPQTQNPDAKPRTSSFGTFGTYQANRDVMTIIGKIEKETSAPNYNSYASLNFDQLDAQEDENSYVSFNSDSWQVVDKYIDGRNAQKDDIEILYSRENDKNATESPSTSLRESILAQFGFGRTEPVEVAPTEPLNLAAFIHETYHFSPEDVPHFYSTITNLLDETQLLQLWEWIPARYRLQQLKRVFHSKEDGFHLHTLIYKCDVYQPTVIIVRTAGGCVFGAFISSSLEKNFRYRGTGETFVFQVSSAGEMNKWGWTKQNNLFVMVDSTTLRVGGGTGMALWLDQELHRGASSYCETFGSPQLSEEKDFECVEMEAFVLL